MAGLQTSTSADVFTGEGLDEALAGADVAIDVVNSATPDDSAQAFFERTSANLSAAAADAAVGHYVVLSIVGADRLAPVSGYMRGKVAQEAAAAASGVPWTAVRSTQFHELAEAITESLLVTVAPARRGNPRKFDPSRLRWKVRA